MASEGLQSEGFHLKVFRWGVRHLRVGSKILKTLVNSDKLGILRCIGEETRKEFEKRDFWFNYIV